MTSTIRRIAWGTFLFGVTALLGCSSDDGDESAGPTGTTGSLACTGDPPVTEHHICADIASEKRGDAGFALTSPDFAFCGEIPASMTCDGNDFGTGASPSFTWSGAPAGSMSFAAVFKDISILADADPATERFGYHWVMWNIPASATSLPGAMTGGYHSTEVPGALQWSSLGSYGFFTPCPNPFPREAPMFACSLVNDSYALVLYALPMASLDDLPAPDLDPETGMPVAGSNWVVNMAHAIEALPALAVTEYRGTSKAWAAAFVPPSAAEFPCTQTMITAGMTDGCLH